MVFIDESEVETADVGWLKSRARRLADSANWESKEL